MMKLMVPTFLSNLVETKKNHFIVESIKNGVSIHIWLGNILQKVHKDVKSEPP